MHHGQVGISAIGWKVLYFRIKDRIGCVSTLRMSGSCGRGVIGGRARFQEGQTIGVLVIGEQGFNHVGPFLGGGWGLRPFRHNSPDGFLHPHRDDPSEGSFLFSQRNFDSETYFHGFLKIY